MTRNVDRQDRTGGLRVAVLFVLHVFVVVLAASGATACAGELRGTVRDSQSGRPLPGANVTVIGTRLGAAADDFGRFVISQLPPGRYNLRVSMIGYAAKEIRNLAVSEGKVTKAVSVYLDKAVLQLEPVVVSATKMRQNLRDAPVSISVVSAEEIRRRNPVDLVQALELAPGVNFIGSQINVRGSTGFTFGAGNKVLLLVDGVPVQASDTGEFNWDMLSPQDVQQIEIVKGAGSALWGAAALGGVVNIITKRPTQEGRLRFSYTLGKYDRPYFDRWLWTDPGRLHYTREDISYSKGIGGLAIRASLSRVFDTGYRQLGDARKYCGTLRWDYRLSGGATWTAYASYNWISRGFFVQWKGQNDPYEVDPTQLNNRARIHQLNTYTRLVMPLSSKLAASVRASVVRTLLGNQFGTPGDFNPAFGQGAELQVDWLPHPAHSVTLGLQYQQDGGSTRFFGDHSGSFLGPYVQDEWRLRSNLRLTAGARYDRYELDGRRKEDLLSPRIGINYQPLPTTSIRGSIGSGFRAATIVERFLELEIMNFTIKANPGLKSERSWAYDFGIRHYLSSDWVIDLSFFRNDYWQLIEAHLDLIRGSIRFRNIPRARIQGIEGTTELMQPLWLLGHKVNLGVRSSITWLQHEELEFHDPLPYRPKLIGHAAVSLRYRAVEAELDYRYASRIEQVKVYPINQRVPMKFWDARVSLAVGTLTLQFVCRNLFQYNYAPMESNLEAPRTLSLAVVGEL